MKYDPTLTAIGGKKPTTSARMLSEEDTHKKVLDFGCGKLRNSNFLKEKGFNVNIHDIPEQLKKVNTEGFTVVSIVPKNTFDLVLCSFVLNVVELPIRAAILSTIKQSLKREGAAYIEVRRTVPVKHKIPFKDGILVGKNKIKTFQKPFNKKEFIELLETSGFKIVSVKQQSHAIAVKAVVA